MKYLLIAIVGLFFAVNCVQSFGHKDHLEPCAIADLSTHTNLNEREVCNSEKGLECSGTGRRRIGKCECSEETSIYQVLKGKSGACVGGAGFPCLNLLCVKNSKCIGDTCVCDEGYKHDDEDTCTSMADFSDKSDNSTEPNKSSGPNLGPQYLTLVLMTVVPFFLVKCFRALY